MKTSHGYSLIELLTVVAIATVLFSLVGRLFADGWLASRDAITHAENNRLVVIAAQRWQRTLRETDPADWRTNENTLRAGDRYIRRDEDTLVFGDGAGSSAVHLPTGIECTFSIERHPASVDCAVMNLAISSRFFRAARTNTVRIVGCGRKAP